MSTTSSEDSSGRQPVIVVPGSPRIPSLDVLRGIAVLSALFISIWVFAGFSLNQQNSLLLQSKGWNYRIFGAMSLLFDGKMRALISLEFGAGLCLFFVDDNRKGSLPAADLFIRKQLWLIAFGLTNGLLLLWTRDVLFHLGIMGILLFPLIRLSAKSLLVGALIFTFIYSAKNYWSYTDDRAAYNKYLLVTVAEKKMASNNPGKNKVAVKSTIDSLSKQQKNDKQAWEGIAGNYKYDAAKDAASIKAVRSTSYGTVWNYLLPALQSKESRWTYSFGVWDFGSMILLGMAIFKMGFFNSKFSKKQYLLIAITGLTIGLLSGWFRLYHNQLALHDYVKYINHYTIPFNVLFPFERAFMAIGYGSLIVAMMEAGLLKLLWRAFAATGRMSLTNYILQSIFCTLFFTGFGMGYFAMLKQYQLYILVLEICMVEMIVSVFWFRSYRLGPVEWLWHCLSYSKRLPNKLSKSRTTEKVIPAVS